MSRRVQIQLTESSYLIEHIAENLYTKGNLYCVYDGEKVYKYPLVNIWRITEDYGPHTMATPFKTVNKNARDKRARCCR